MGAAKAHSEQLWLDPAQIEQGPAGPPGFVAGPAHPKSVATHPCQEGFELDVGHRKACQGLGQHEVGTGGAWS